MKLIKEETPLTPEEREVFAQQYADAVIAEVEQFWHQAATALVGPLSTAIVSGVLQGFLQIHVTDAGLISSTNTLARQYAQDRAAELVGMKFVDGQLVENPNAEWAISDTTRQRLRQIITDAFSQDIPMDELRDQIQEALDTEAEGNGIFSAARAELIAETEVMRSQNAGNFLAWKESRLVRKVKWKVSNLGPCDECAANQDVIVEFGRPFPSGDLHPPNHPRCRCVLAVVEVGDKQP
jgi:hypothetical protein